MNIGDWLRSLGLGRYEPVFIANAIEGDVLPELTEADLEKLGIPLGDRKRLMVAIRAIIAGAPAAIVRTRFGDSAAGEKAAERRHLTVMICDLVGSTALSARLDPEDMSAVMNIYHATCQQIVASYEGFLADFRGDGVVAYFGYPRAHEDDAERTVRAALEIIAAVGRLETPAGEPVAVRVGIATGLVVVGQGGLRDHTLIGDAPNLAARLEGLVGPNTVVIADSTRRLVGDIFRLRDLGRHQLKGIGKPAAAWVVEGLSSPESRFKAVRPRGVADLVGREVEMGFLLERLRQSWNGDGQAVLISGEPGIGKSRLAAALAERIANMPHKEFRYQCSPYHSNSSLRPIIDHLERAAEFRKEDRAEQRLDKLEALLAVASTKVEAVAPLFAALLSIPTGDRYPELVLSPAQQRRQTLAALLDQYENHARRQPVLLLFEDAQWADATSLELFNLLIEQARHLPMLVLVTLRPDFETPWAGKPNVASLTLGRLDSSGAERLIKQVSRGLTLPTELLRHIIDKTDGNPLFLEELTKTVLEAGIVLEDANSQWLPLAIPETLQDSLMARLDRLGSVKEVAQIGAAIGRQFSYSLIRAVVSSEEAALQLALRELEHAELLYRRGEPPEAIYSFKHALVRDAAYESLLKSRRYQLHGQIATTLEDKFPDVVTSEPEILARHFTEAGMVGLAIGYWLRAGNLAVSRSANAEAVKHLKRGIELTLELAPSPERVRRELDFYLALGPAVAATKGDASQETSQVFARARELLVLGGGGATLKDQMTVLWGTYLAHSMRGEHRAALDIARQCLDLAADHEHPGISALAHRFMGQTLHFIGSFVDCRAYLEQTLTIYQANQETIATYRRFGTDDQVNALSFLASTLMILGYPEQSAMAARRAVHRAQSIGLAFTTALTLSHTAFLGTIGGDPQQALADADEAIAISFANGFASTRQRARFFRGALLSQAGKVQQGIDLMRDAMAAAESHSELNRRTLYLCHIAAAEEHLGQREAALAMLDAAVQTADATDERFFAPEIYRVRGKILLNLARHEEAESALRQALAVARQQQARWWELRAANLLATHWHQQGQHAEAYALLRPIYDGFAEGFELPDLKEARLILDKLNGTSGPQISGQQSQGQQAQSQQAQSQHNQG
jgi:class 3 adenylate cyclase/tetratricopeptide (TPR) repeat protein